MTPDAIAALFSGEQKLITLRQFSIASGINYHHARTLAIKGELGAMDVSSKTSSRHAWRLSREAVDAFFLERMKAPRRPVPIRDAPDYFDENGRYTGPAFK